MRHTIKPVVALALFALLPLTIGCWGSDEAKNKNGEEKNHDHHAEKGPHGGHIIELGRDHSFHAELVEDHDADRISVYILDGKMKEYPISESEITLTVTVKGSSETFPLQAVDPTDGKSAHFEAVDEKLHEQMEQEGAEVKLRANIDGKPYSGALAHDHDH